MSPPRILAIESSCDETACAVVCGTFVESSVVATQIAVHRQFGGIVPELASRHHLQVIEDVVETSLKQAGVSSFSELDGLAVTDSPGLVGALLVGVQMARGLAMGSELPLYGIHHMEGHLCSAFLGDKDLAPSEFVPHVALMVSGGHTELVRVKGLGSYELLGLTRDDAAGEAYDKAGKLLGLPYPGGPVIDQLAQDGNPNAHAFPRSMLDRPGFEFSFSGLKTAMRIHLERKGQPNSRSELADVCASFQAAVVEILVEKSVRALMTAGMKRLHVVGGVAANRGLREALSARALKDGFTVLFPPLRYCGDNAAMIGAAASLRMTAGASARVNVEASRPLDDPSLFLR